MNIALAGDYPARFMRHHRCGLYFERDLGAMGDDFAGVLLPDEKLLWTGKPLGGLMLNPVDFMLVPFSLVWAGIAFVWEYVALTMPQPGQAGFLWGIPFVLIGLYLVFGRFLVDAYLRGKTCYAITDSRLLIRRSGLLPSLQVFQLDQLPAASFDGPRSGAGTLCLGGTGTMSAGDFYAWTPSLAKGARLLNIENAWHVFTLFQQAQRQARVAGR